MAYVLTFDVIMIFDNCNDKPTQVVFNGTYTSYKSEPDEAEAEVYYYWDSDDTNILSPDQIEAMYNAEREYLSIGARLVDVGCKITSISEL